MNQEHLKFSVNQIVVGKSRPFKISEFPEEEFTSSQSHKMGDEVVSISKTEITILEDRFFCVYFEGGDKYPYPNTVFNTKKMDEENNPRPSDQIELSDQFFVVIDEKRQKIYFSNQKRRPNIADWLKRKMHLKEDEVVIKPLFVEKDFIDRIKSVSEISMTVVPNIFNAAGGTTMSQALKSDVLGYDAEEATLTLKYKRKITEEIRARAKDLLKHKSEFKEITIVGKTLDGLEAVFNTSEIVSKVSVASPQDPKTKKYIPEEIFLALTEEIKKLDEK